MNIPQLHKARAQLIILLASKYITEYVKEISVFVYYFKSY